MRANSEIERVNETRFDKMKKKKKSKLYRSELEVDESTLTSLRDWRVNERDEFRDEDESSFMGRRR